MGELSDLVGISGTTTACDKVLDGEYNTDHLLPATSAILHEFCRRTSLPSIKSNITYEQYEEGWERWKESTATLPSG